MNPTDFHVLLVLAAAPLYGYAILKAVESESLGAVSLEIGSLYRALGRLASTGLVEETDPPPHGESGHPGLPRRYYRLTREGRAALQHEATRLATALELARDRRLVPRQS